MSEEKDNGINESEAVEKENNTIAINLDSIVLLFTNQGEYKGRTNPGRVGIMQQGLTMTSSSGATKKAIIWVSYIEFKSLIDKFDSKKIDEKLKDQFNKNLQAELKSITGLKPL